MLKSPEEEPKPELKREKKVGQWKHWPPKCIGTIEEHDTMTWVKLP